jgi:hypothetical protein
MWHRENSSWQAPASHITGYGERVPPQNSHTNNNSNSNSNNNGHNHNLGSNHALGSSHCISTSLPTTPNIPSNISVLQSALSRLPMSRVPGR